MRKKDYIPKQSTTYLRSRDIVKNKVGIVWHDLLGDREYLLVNV